MLAVLLIRPNGIMGDRELHLGEGRKVRGDAPVARREQRKKIAHLNGRYHESRTRRQLRKLRISLKGFS